MVETTLVAQLDHTPDRPAVEVGRPQSRVVVTVDVEAAHLANPLMAVARLLASEAEAHALVTGDEGSFTVSVAVPDLDRSTIDNAVAWIRWAVHNAGVRGVVRPRPA